MIVPSGKNFGRLVFSPLIHGGRVARREPSGLRTDFAVVVSLRQPFSRVRGSATQGMHADIGIVLSTPCLAAGRTRYRRIFGNALRICGNAGKFRRAGFFDDPRNLLRMGPSVTQKIGHALGRGRSNEIEAPAYGNLSLGGSADVRYA